eukprot:gene2015-2051_t
MSATPTIAISANSQAFLGSTQTLDVTFSNTAVAGSLNAVGYAPFVVLSLDSLGVNNAATGVSFGGATYLGTPVDATVATFDGSGNYPIPNSNDGTGHQIVVHGSAGNQVVLLSLPFGSFTPGQTPADIKVSLNVAADAKVGALLPVTVQGGFLYGTSELGDTNSNPTLITGGATISLNPTVLSVTSIYSGPEGEVAAGPSNKQFWKVLGTLANGATISNLTLVDKLANGAIPTQVTLYDGNSHSYVYTVDNVAGTLTAVTAGAPPVQNSASGAGPWVYYNAAANIIQANFGTVTGNAGSGPYISTQFYSNTTQSLGSAALANTTAGADFQVIDMLPFGAVASTFTVNSPNGAFVYQYDASQAGNATHGVSLVSQGAGTTPPAILTGPGAAGSDWVHYDATAGKIVANFHGIAVGGVGMITATYAGGQYQLPGTVSQTYGSGAGSSLLVDQLNGGTTTASFTITHNGLKYVYKIIGGVPVYQAGLSTGADIGVLGSAAAVSAGQGVYFDAANFRIYTNFGAVAAGSSTTISAVFTGADTVNSVTGHSYFAGNDVSGGGGYTSVAYGASQVTSTPPSPGGNQSNIAGQDIVVAKALAVQKSVANPDGLQPGGHLNWTIDGQISNYADITNLVVTDTLGDGQHFDPSGAATPTLLAVSNGVTVFNHAFDPTEYTVNRDPNTGVTTIVFKLSAQLVQAMQAADLNGGAAPGASPSIPATASFKIGFTSVIDDHYISIAPSPSVDRKVEQGDTLANGVIATGNLVGTGSAVSDDSAASDTIPVGHVTKTIYQVNGLAYVPGQHIQAGDDVTYRLTYTLPITRADNVTLTDFLPLPVFSVDKTNGASLVGYTFNAGAAGTTPLDGQVTWASTDTFHTSAAGHVPMVSVDDTNNKITVNFGAVDNAANGNAGSTIDLLFTTKVLDKPFIDNLNLTNQVTSSETNSFGSISTDNAIVQVRLGQPVLNVEKGVVSSTGNSQTFTGSKGPISFGTAGTAGTVIPAGSKVTSANLAATPLSDTLSGAQGGDIVRFAIAIENTGHGAKGAFDIVLHDVLPNGYVIPATGLHLTVTDGNGTALNYVYVGSDNSLFGSDFNKDGIELINGATPSLTVYDPNSGTNIAIVTYDLQLVTNIPEPNYRLTNTASVTAFSALAGGANFATGPAAGNLTAQTTVITHPIDAVKTVKATSESSNGADKDALKIGEQVTFQVTETLGRGTLSNVVLHDLLNGGDGKFTFVSGQITAFGGAITSSTGVHVGSALTGTVGGTSASLDLGNVVVNTDSLDSSATITYTVVANYAGTVVGSSTPTSAAGGQTLVNDASVTATNPNDSTTITTGTAQVTLHSAEPELVLSKTVRDITTPSGFAGTASVNASDHVQYMLHLVNNQDGHSATAYDIDIKDLLALYGVDKNGQPNVKFDVGSVMTVGGTVVHGNTAGDTYVEVTAGSLAPNGFIDITFTGVVSPDAEYNNNIPNTATFTADTLPDTDLAKLIPGNNRVESGQASASLHVNTPTSSKAITATSDATTPGNQITVGEVATYTVTTALPTGDSTTLKVVDTLPVGLGNAVAHGAPVATGATYSGFTTDYSVPGVVTYTFNNVHATAAGANIAFKFDATVLDVASNTTNGKTLTNTVATFTDGTLVNTSTYDAQLLLGSLSGHIWFDQNTNGVQDGTVVDINEPGILVRLFDASNTLINSVFTGANGEYSFQNLKNGNYHVSFQPLVGYGFSPMGQDADKSIDSVVDINGVTAPVAVTAGHDTANQNAAINIPHLKIVKQESISSGQAGDLVTYTATVSELSAIPAFNVSIADLLAPGEILVAHSETVSGGSGGADTIVEAGTGFTVTAPRLLSGDQPIVVTYQAKLADSVVNGQTITNTANLTYSNAASGGVTYTGSSQQTLTAHLVDQFSKTFSSASQGGGNLVLPDETITFDLTATLARGTQGLVLTDTLPTGLTAVSAKVISEGNATSTTLHTGDLVAASGQNLTLDFGTVVNPGSSTTAPGDQIVVRVTATVDHNAPIGSTITNFGTLKASVPGGAVYEIDTAQASVKVINPGTISGMVFLDGQCDGIYHAGDLGMAGVTVRLLDNHGNYTGASTTTDGFGRYAFTYIIPGQYEIQIVSPQGTDYSDEKNAGSNPLLDSDVSPTTGITDLFTVAGGQTVAGINAGLEFNGYFGGVSPIDIGNGAFGSNSGGNTILGHGGNVVGLGGPGGDIVVLDGKGLTSYLEVQGSGNEIVTSCGPLIAQTLTSGHGYLFTAGDQLVVSGLSTEIIYQKGDGVLSIYGSLRAQDSLEISGYTHGTYIKVGVYDALYLGGNDLIVFYGNSPAALGGSVVSYLSLPPTVEKVVVFGADGKPLIVDAGVTPVPPAPAPLVPAVPPAGGGSPPVPPVPGSSQTVVLSGYSQVWDFATKQASANINTTISGSQGFATITVGDGTNSVTASGYGNVIKAGAGNNTIIGGDTYQKVTVGGGTNTITLLGTTNTVTAGDGANIIHAGSGGEIVTVGHGHNSITATGSANVITAGNGGDDISAGDSSNTVTVGSGTNTVTVTGYSNHITVGSGHSTINAGAGGAVVTLAAGTDTVTFNGWSNLLIGGAGHATVSGGTNDVFQVAGVGSAGGFDVMDFGTAHNDLLDLSKLLSGITLTPANVASYVNVTASGSDTVVAVDLAGTGSFANHVVATLHGAGAHSLSDLQTAIPFLLAALKPHDRAAHGLPLRKFVSALIRPQCHRPHATHDCVAIRYAIELSIRSGTTSASPQRLVACAGADQTADLLNRKNHTNTKNVFFRYDLSGPSKWIYAISLTRPVQPGAGVCLSPATPENDLMSATPTIAVSSSRPALLGSTQFVDVTFSNTANASQGNATGYAPFVVLTLDAQGGPLGGANGVTFNGATFMGLDVDATVVQLDGSGVYAIPKSNDGTGAPITVTGPVNGTAVLLTLPFGSFTPGQTPADIKVSLTVDPDAKLGTALPVTVQGGFLYGTSELGDSNSNPTIVTPAASLSLDPKVFTVTQTYDGPENEIAAGPSNQQSFTVLGTLANGATINELTLVDKLPNGAVPTVITLDNGKGVLSHFNVDPATGALTQIDGPAYTIQSATAGTSPWISYNKATNTVEAGFGTVKGGIGPGPSIATKFYVSQYQNLGSAEQASTTGADFTVTDMLPYGAVASTFTVDSDNGAFVYSYDATHGVQLVSQGAGTAAPQILNAPGAAGSNWVYYDVANGKIVSNFHGIAAGHVGSIDAAWSGGAPQLPGQVSKSYAGAASSSLLVDQLNGDTKATSFTLTHNGLTYVYDVNASGVASFNPGASTAPVGLAVKGSAASVSNAAGVYYDAANFRIYANFGAVAAGDTTTIAASFTGGETVNTTTGASFQEANNASGTGLYHSAAYGSAAVSAAPTSAPAPQDNIPGENIVTAKAIALQKSVAMADNLQPGGHLTWTLNGQISNYADIANLVVTDSLGDGQHFDDTAVPTLVAISNGNTVYSAPLSSGDYAFVRDPDTGVTTITFKISDQLAAAGKAVDLNGGAAPTDSPAVPAPASFKIVFTSVIDDTYMSTKPKPSVDSKVEQGDTLANNVIVTGTLVNGGAAVSDDSHASETIPVGQVSKTIYQVNGQTYAPGQIIQAGDDVTYRLTYTLPITRADNVTLQDFLPLPVFSVNETNGKTANTYSFDAGAAGTTPADGVVTWGPSDTLHTDGTYTGTPGVSVVGNNNQLVINFGSIDNAPNFASNTIDLLFTTKVLDKPFIDDLKLTNEVTSSETNSFGDVSHDSAIVQVTLGQPVLKVEKGVVATTGTHAFSGSVGPVAFSAPGTSGVAFSSLITSTNLSAAPLSDTLYGAQGGDVVRFAVTVENDGHSPKGAFDVVLHDTVPNGFVVPAAGLHLEVTDGLGHAISYITVGTGLFDPNGGIELVDPSSSQGALTTYNATSGTNIAVITYDLAVDPAVPTPNYQLTNVATVTHFAALDGGNDYSKGPDAGTLSASSTVVTQPVVATKSVLSTSESPTGADAQSLKIGEIVTYQVTETFGEGTTKTVILSDTLPTNPGTLTFLSGVVTQLGTALTNTGGVVVGTTLAANGTTGGFLNLGDVVAANHNLDASDTITYTVTAAFEGANAGNAGGQTLINTAIATAANPNGSGVVTTGTATASVHTTAPELNFSKQVEDLTTGAGFSTKLKANAGDLVEYKVTLSNGNDGNANAAYNVQIKDLLDTFGTDPLGNPNVTIDPSSLTIVGTSSGATIASDADAAHGGIVITAGTIATGGTITFTFKGTIASDAVFNTTITNTATYSATTLPNSDATGFGRTLTGSAEADIVTTKPSGSKVIAASSSIDTTGTVLTIGEVATYTITVAVPEGSTGDLKIVDTLPTGLSFVPGTLNAIAAYTNTGVTVANGAVTPTVSGQTITWDLGAAQAPSGGGTIKLSFDAQVQNNSSTNVDGDTLTNYVRTYSNGTLSSTGSLTAKVSLGSLSGHVWLDQNGDGIQNGGDINGAGVTVQLLDSTGHAIAGAVTNTLSDGSYSFKNLVDGSYAVQVVPPAGDEFSPVGTSGTASINSVVNSSGITPEYVVNAGTNTPNLNAAYYAPAALGDKVFTDFNANGVQDAGDTGIAGLTVTLLDGSGNITDGHGNAILTTQVTDSSGLYHFTDLRPGSYEVQFTKANGDHFTQQFASGAGTGLDSNANVTTGVAPSVTLVSGQIDNTIDAGIYTPVTISGTVFTDLNDNGVKDTYDTGIGSIEVDLLKDGVKVGQLSTNADGTYSFTDRIPGNYAVKVINSTPDTFSPVGTDADKSKDSIVNASGATAQKTLVSGDTLPNQNAGLFPPQPKLSVTKQESITSGQAGDVVTYTVTVAEAAGNTNPAFNITLADLLAPGETLVKGTETIKGGSGLPDAITETGTGFVVHADQLLTGDKPLVITYQATLADSVVNGQTITNTASLGYDSAPNGGLHYTGSDSQTLTAHLTDGLSKSLVTLSQNGGNLVLPGETVTYNLTATLGHGTQHLVLTDSLPAGLTAVSAQVISEGQVITTVPLNTIVTPSGNSFTADFGTLVTPGNTSGNKIQILVTATVDDNATIGSTITNTATLSASVPGGAVYETETASSKVKVVAPSKITGMVFLDGQCSGIYHVGDLGMAGVTVRLLDGAGNPTGITTRTDSYGKYTFDRLIPGQYEVQIVAPKGTDYSDEKNAGTNPLLDSDVNPATGITDVITLVGGDVVAGVNAGLEFNGAFGGSAPNDIGNGMFASNSGHNTILGHGGNTVLLGGNGGDIVVLDGKGVASAVEVQGSGDEIVTSCGPLQAQTLTSGTGYIFVVVSGLSTVIIYQKGDGVLRIDGSLRSQDKLEIVGYDPG